MITLEDLIEDVLVKIFSFVNLNELAILELVCKKWKHVIDQNDIIWKKHIPRSSIPITFQKSLKPKKILKNLHKTSLKCGAELWYPNPYKLLCLRENLIDYCNQWGFGGKVPMHAKFTMYIRLNPSHDLVTDPKSSEDIVKEIWKEFGAEDFHYLSSVDDVIKHSCEINYEKLLKVFQNTFEPKSLAKYHRGGVDESGKINLSEFSLLGTYDEKDLSPETFEVVAIRTDDNDWSSVADANLSRNYRPPSLALYQKVMKAMLGPDGDQKVRHYYLDAGCFNENYEYSKEIYVGSNAAFFVSRFYDL